MAIDPNNLAKHVGTRLTALTGMSKFNDANGVPFNALFSCESVEWTPQDLTVRVLSQGPFEGQLWKQSEAKRSSCSTNSSSPTSGERRSNK